VTRKMLINAQRAEELRIAVISDGQLDRYEVAAAESGLYRGNIYRGVVASVQLSLGAAFVEIGVERQGLLRAEDVVPTAYHRKVEEDERRPRIDRILERGQPVLVQVVRDGVGTKGPLLTTNLSIAGRYLVLMPYDEVRGVSRRAEEDEVRKEIKERLAEMSLPEGVGVIARTNAIDQPKATLNRDLSALLRLWKKVHSEAGAGRGPRLLYSDQDLLIQALRDFLDSSVEEVLVDDDEAFAKARGYMESFMPRARTRLVRYADRMPIFSRFGLEEQIDTIYQRKVGLPSGGSIVIDGTEALTAIDVNSGRATRGSSQEETAYSSNMEAASEVARQLRLRDIGGLVVVDFIDMRSPKHQRDVEKTLREAMRDDKARFTVGRISANGLLEINRQRLKKALQLRTHRPCPTCEGAGTIPSPELIGLNLLRRIETRAVTGRLKAVRASLHPELADAIQNERRQELAALEREFEIKIEIIADTGLHRSEEDLEWVQREDKVAADKAGAAAVSAADLAVAAGKPSQAKAPSRSAKEPPTPAKDASAAAEGGEPGEAKKAPRKRRRGGRRHRKSAAPAEGGRDDEGRPADPEPPAAPDPPLAPSADPQPAAGPEPAPPTRASRRRPWWRLRKKSEE